MGGSGGGRPEKAPADHGSTRDAAGVGVGVWLHLLYSDVCPCEEARLSMVCTCNVPWGAGGHVKRGHHQTSCRVGVMRGVCGRSWGNEGPSGEGQSDQPCGRGRAGQCPLRHRGGQPTGLWAWQWGLGHGTHDVGHDLKAPSCGTSIPPYDILSGPYTPPLQSFCGVAPKGYSVAPELLHSPLTFFLAPFLSPSAPQCVPMPHAHSAATTTPHTAPPPDAHTQQQWPGQALHAV